LARITLPDGTPIRASSIAARRAVDPERDFGLYLDPGWEPDWPSELIDWPDFGLPTDSEIARRQIIGAYERARGGASVEVGCLGGLGRTGTVLACFVVLCGLEASNAIRWVRTSYDPAAIETVQQERWVEWFAARIIEDERAE
jgi:hypothetical protein